MGKAKDKLIVATYKVLAKKGYERTTTSEIAKTAGVSEMTLFREFRNKDNLIRAAYHASFQNSIKSIEKVFASKRSDDLQSNLVALEKQLLEHANERANIFFAEMKREMKHLRGHGDEAGIMRRHLEYYFQEQIDAGNMRKVNPKAAAFVFFSIISSLKLYRVSNTRYVLNQIPQNDMLEILLHGIIDTTKEKSSKHMRKIRK
jgi:AcrR family transcriptional regulator